MNQVRLAAIDGFEDLLKSLDVSVEDVLHKSNLPADYFEQHSVDDWIDYDKVETLLTNAAEISGRVCFAANMGMRQHINMLGLVGYLMRQSRTMGEALEEFCTHFSLHVKHAARIDVLVENETAMVSFMAFDEGGTYRQCNEGAIAQGLVIIRALSDAHWVPRCLHFHHPCPDAKIDYKAIFGAPVLFSQARNQVVFNAADLLRKIPEADPQLKKILAQQVALASKPAEDDLVTRVEHLIHQTLPAGKCCVESIASLLFVHRRTLHRMLRKNDTSFTQLLENVRRRVSMERLESSNMPIAQLADYLGYTDSSAFNRAFKRWTQHTPKQWRRLHKVKRALGV
ncbi:MAG: AraC-like DNA-binding protein [Flavobacteriales bacterium]|jgi:AraC-like DNA-binding protein